MYSGIDISNHQGYPPTYETQPWFAEAQFVIVQAIPRTTQPGITAQQLQHADANKKWCGIYVWLWHTPSWRLGDQSVEDDMRIRLATVPDDVQMDMRVWLDVEDNQSSGWNQVSIAQRVDDVNRALAVLDDWSYARGLTNEAGIYWSKWFIDLLFGGRDYFGRKQWLAHYINPSTGQPAPGSLIGGPVVAHQWTSTPVDKNQMLESEIVTVAEPEPVSPPDCSALVNALAYLGDDLPPLLELAMQGRTTVAKKKQVRDVARELRRVRAQMIGPPQRV